MRGEKEYKTVDGAVNALKRLYDQEAGRIVESWQGIAAGKKPDAKVQGFYPEVSVKISSPPIATRDRTMAYGFCVRNGTYSSTFTRPDLFGDYYHDQLTQIRANHPDAVIEVGYSHIPIPVTFALHERVKVDGTVKLTQGEIERFYDIPNDRHFANDELPLSQYNAPLTDRAMGRIRHYTGTDPAFFQRYILFANYDDYIDLFRRRAREILAERPDPADPNPYVALVTPGNMIETSEHVAGLPQLFAGAHSQKLGRRPQMEALHLVKADGSGISIVNIGVGPSNAKTITDEIAVLRPQAWLMVGHCAGLSYSQDIGDYVIPNAFVLEDGLMEKKMAGVPIPEISEIHRSMSDAIKTVLGVERDEYRASVRSGVVTTVADRNWEVAHTQAEREARNAKFAANKSFALDMESGTICANGLHHQVPYGAILCVSDKPLHGIPKMPGMAQEFYRARVAQQFDIAWQCIDNIREKGDTMHSRKLRSDWDLSPFR
jgi:AMP nucleosidase